MTTHIRVGDYMNDTPPNISSSMLISAVIETLFASHLAGAPVVDEQNQVVGFVSEHDCIGKLIQSSYYCEPELSAGDVMSTTVKSVHPNDNVLDLAQEMLSSRRYVYPVIDNDQLKGVINRSMVLMALKENQQEC